MLAVTGLHVARLSHGASVCLLSGGDDAVAEIVTGAKDVDAMAGGAGSSDMKVADGSAQEVEDAGV